jgi:hypothetical protein
MKKEANARAPTSLADYFANPVE